MTKVFNNSSITPAEAYAGDSEEFIIKLEVGPVYNSESSRLVFDFMQRLGASPPSLTVNEDQGYVEVYISNPHVKYYKKRWCVSRKEYVNKETPPLREGSRMIVVDIVGKLNEGDTIELHFGETTMGFGPGAKVSTVVPRPETYEFLNIRYFDSKEKGMPDYGTSYPGYSRPEPDAEEVVKFRILPREAKRLRILRKLDKTLLLPYDRFWNIAEIDKLDEIAEVTDAAEKNSQNVFVFKNKDIQVKSKKLPITDTPNIDNVYEGMNIYWGDLHTHSKYSADCLSRSRMDMLPGELMEFARDRAGLDFFAVTDHNNPGHNAPSHILLKEQWKDNIAAINKYHKDNEFVVFAGFEYSTARGDTCVIMNWYDENEDLDPEECPDLRALWKIYEKQGHDYMTIPHFHGPGQLEEGTWWENKNFNGEPVIEVFSDHGSYEREDVFEGGRADCKAFRWDRCAKYFLQNGYKYGHVGHSDDHKGHVGVNGITGIYAAELTRESVFEAYRKRRTYATSNARIRLLFTANGELMGSEIKNTADKEFLIDVVGENTLKKIDLFKDGEIYKTFIPEGIAFKEIIKVKDEAPSNWYVRVTQLDNHIAISSPVWFE
ncbi:MAG: DUF3604 domain-containing protein [Planctomycetota bacterium]|jgi:hypothetical protein